jgi:small-conductance mechanosensitive channel
VREALQHFLTAVVEVLPKLATAVVVLSLFWGLATLARRLVGAVATYIQDQSVRMLVTQLPYYFVWAAGFIVTLDAIGVNLQAAVTALGLGGVAIGFALKDILSNLVSGVLILAMRPFEIGDQIVVGDTEGTVEQIELRATEIRTYDGRLVLVPNGEVFTSRITNNTASPVRRASVDVYLGYKEDFERALTLILDTVRSVPGVVESPAPSMRLRELTEDGLHLEARFWADSHRTNLMNTASAARIAILRALREAGIQLHDPERRVVTIRPGTAGAAAAETFPEEFQHPNGTADRRTNRVSPPSTS